MTTQASLLAQEVQEAHEAVGETTHSIPTETDEFGRTQAEIPRALDIARELVKAGTPVFVARPCPLNCTSKDHKPGDGHNGTGFHFPSNWQTTNTGGNQVDRWREGDALCAVGGHAVDFLDIDPRNGGDVSASMLKEGRAWPFSYGQQSTPSGGTHDLIASLGVPKGEPAPGIDLQAGAPDGTGRGFAFIPPTVKRSKTTGAMAPYRWEVEPDLEMLAIEGPSDDSGAEIADMVRASKGKSSSSPSSSCGGEDSRPYGTPAGPEETADRVMALRHELANAPKGAGNGTAYKIGCMVGGYVAAEQIDSGIAFSILKTAFIAWDWDDPSDKFKMESTLRRGLDKGASGQPRPWMAGHKVRDFSDLLLDVGPPPPPTTDAVDALLGKMLDLEALEKLPPPKPLIRDVLDLDSESWIIGAPGGFKSFVALDWACHVATGQEWRGKPVHQGRVIYVAAEGKKGIPLRVKAWMKTYAPHRPGDVRFLPEPVQVTDPKAWATLVEACRRLEPVLIVLDTQARITVGLDENSSAMSSLTDAVSKLRAATGACVLVVHHTGRNGQDGRGWSGIDGAQDTEIRVDRPEKKAARAQLTATISTDKQKDNDESVKFDIQLEVVDLGQSPEDGRPLTSLALKPHNPFLEPVRIEPDHVANLVPNQGDLLEALREHANNEYGATAAQLIRFVKDRSGRAISPGSAGTALDGLMKKGLVVRVGQRYILPEYAE